MVYILIIARVTIFSSLMVHYKILQVLIIVFSMAYNMRILALKLPTFIHSLISYRSINIEFL